MFMRFILHPSSRKSNRFLNVMDCVPCHPFARYRNPLERSVRRGFERIAPVLVVLTLLVVTPACDTATTSEEEDSSEPDPPDIVRDDVSATDAQAAREFWTPERMERAVAYPVGIEGEPPATSAPTTPGPNVEMKQRSGEPPADVGAEVFSGLLEDAAPNPSKASQPSAASQVTTSYTQYPLRTMGKVFFRKEGGGLFVCSASVIASENKSVVWTAGHCVAGQGEESWHDQWIFVPAYQNGDEPLGRWAARTKATFVSWYSGGNRNYDLGAVVMERRNERPIASVTGSLGWMFNAQRDIDYQEFGYPTAGNLFSGNSIWTCSSPYAGGDGVGSNAGPRTSSNKCDFTAGASGGPWVASFEGCPSCYINSVNSWWWWRRGHSHLAEQWAGPYHGRAALKLLQFAEGI